QPSGRPKGIRGRESQQAASQRSSCSLHSGQHFINCNICGDCSSQFNSEPCYFTSGNGQSTRAIQCSTHRLFKTDSTCRVQCCAGDYIWISQECLTLSIDAKQLCAMVLKEAAESKHLPIMGDD